MTPSPLLAYGAFISCSLIWGSTFLVISIGNDTIPPVWAATLRLGAAAILLTAMTFALGQRMPRGKALVAAAWYGLFGFGINFPLLYLAEEVVASGITAVIYATIPLTTALFSRAFGLERLSLRKIFGAAIALAGVAIIFSAQIGEDVPFGWLSVLVLSSSVAALGGVLLKRGGHQSPIPANAIGCIVGFVICLPVSLVMGEPHPIPSSAAEIFPIAYLTLVGSAGAYVIMAWLLNHWSATNISFITVNIPVIALLLGVAIRSEPITGSSLLGAVLVLSGVVVGVIMDRSSGTSPHEPIEQPAS